LDCRLYHLGVAAAGLIAGDTAGIAANTQHCPHSGWDGAGVCGSGADYYCAIQADTCTGSDSNYASTTDCAKWASYLPRGSVADGDTLECRVYHVQVAANSVASSDVTAHCGHSRFYSTGPCGSVAEAFCDAEASICTIGADVDGSNKWLYDTYDHCVTIASSLSAGQAAGAIGATGATSGDSLSCRQYHLSVAAGSTGAATTHCPHTLFESGDATCGTKCESYCAVQAAVCTGATNQQFGGVVADCVTACDAWTLGMDTDKSGDTFGCRAYHLLVASESTANADNHCKHTANNVADGMPCVVPSVAVSSSAAAASSTGDVAPPASTGLSSGAAVPVSIFGAFLAVLAALLL